MDASHYAELLREAATTKTPISNLRDTIGIEDIAFAYQIQQLNTTARILGGARVLGKKIGLTSKSVQTQLGVDQPDFGMLFDDMEVQNGGQISLSAIMQPKVEGELAFVLGEDLTDDQLTTVDVMKAIAFVLPSIEIVGSRIANWDIKITDTIADNASASHFVLGHTPKLITAIDIVNTEMLLTSEGKTVSSGNGSACLGSPINAILWLAKTMVKMETPLLEGDIILTGALGSMHPIEKAQRVEATFSGIGNVSVEFID